MNSSRFDPTRHNPTRALRVAAKKTLAEVAAKAGVSKSHLSRMESGERRMTMEMQARVGKAIRGRR